MAMDGSDYESYNIDWNSDDERDIDQNLPSPYGSSSSISRRNFATANGEGCSSARSQKFSMIDDFVEMGFPEEWVLDVIDENGEEYEEILDKLLGRQALESSFVQRQDVSSSLALLATPKQLQGADSDSGLSESEGFLDDLNQRKRKFSDDLEIMEDRNKRVRDLAEENEPSIHLPRQMIGFGVPTNTDRMITTRNLPEQAIGPPYFYFENVAKAPRETWDTISQKLYEVKPEFVDSLHFCAAARKRGYVHNLPIKNRFPLLPLPPRKIQEALPLTERWWPSWDKRTRLNCIKTCIGSAKQIGRIRKILETYENDPPLDQQKFILLECRENNLIWVGKNKLANLECNEIEMILGFPENHTRGISQTARYKSLGNSFQVDTVAYHLSVLKNMYPDGINLLSLFSGIGGAEVALHRLGIRLKNVVSVEISQDNRYILKNWWEQTNQKGSLIEIADIKQLNGDRLEQLMGSFGGFDLVVGGSPCNNLSGNNRWTRHGLEGEESKLFYDYCRVLDLVKRITRE